MHTGTKLKNKYTQYKEQRIVDTCHKANKSIKAKYDTFDAEMALSNQPVAQCEQPTKDSQSGRLSLSDIHVELIMQRIDQINESVHKPLPGCSQDTTVYSKCYK